MADFGKRLTVTNGRGITAMLRKRARVVVTSASGLKATLDVSAFMKGQPARGLTARGRQVP